MKLLNFVQIYKNYRSISRDMGNIGRLRSLIISWQVFKFSLQWKNIIDEIFSRLSEYTDVYSKVLFYSEQSSQSENCSLSYLGQMILSDLPYVVPKLWRVFTLIISIYQHKHDLLSVLFFSLFTFVQQFLSHALLSLYYSHLWSSYMLSHFNVTTV